MCKKKKKKKKKKTERERDKRKEKGNEQVKIKIFWLDVVTYWIFAILLRWTDIDLSRGKKITIIKIYWLIFVV